MLSSNIHVKINRIFIFEAYWRWNERKYNKIQVNIRT